MSRRRLQVNKGDRYGHLTIIKEVEPRLDTKGVPRRYFLCQCDCGNTTVASLGNLRKGDILGCGCLVGLSNRTHYETKTRLYRIWASMKRRCHKTTNMNYGGRGIKICSQWENYEPFRDWALSHGYSDKLTIDRKDVNGDYCPENCRWATMKQQSNNKRNNHVITIGEESKTIAEWSEFANIPYCTMRERVSKGWEGKRLLVPINSDRRPKPYKTDMFKDRIIELYNQGKRIEEISTAINIGRNAIVAALKRWGVYILYNPKKMIVQLSKAGDYLNTYESISEAARQVCGETSAISVCCNDLSKTAYGFRWMFAKDYDHNHVKLD